MGDASRVFRAPYDGNSIVGLGYQRYPWAWGDLLIGCEIGVGARFAQPMSGEIWTGPTIRYDGLAVPHALRVTPSFTAGFSAVTDAMGKEREREFSHNGDANLLFYLGPEIAVSATARPNIELFYRLHHRSGANGTLGHLMEGYNANVVGFRFRF